jgi:hypothetical protein
MTIKRKTGTRYLIEEGCLVLSSAMGGSSGFEEAVSDGEAEADVLLWPLLWEPDVEEAEEADFVVDDLTVVVDVVADVDVSSSPVSVGEIASSGGPIKNGVDPRRTATARAVGNGRALCSASATTMARPILWVNSAPRISRGSARRKRVLKEYQGKNDRRSSRIRNGRYPGRSCRRRSRWLGGVDHVSVIVEWLDVRLQYG